MLLHVSDSPSLLRLNTFHCIYTAFCFSIYPSMDTELVFHILALVNNATNTCLRPCFQFFLVYTQVELLSPIVILFLILGRTVPLFSVATAPFYIPNDNWYHLSYQCEVVSHCDFCWHFPND